MLKINIRWRIWRTFETFHRPSEMNIIGYINEFERLYN